MAPMVIVGNKTIVIFSRKFILKNTCTDVQQPIDDKEILWDLNVLPNFLKTDVKLHAFSELQKQKFPTIRLST